MTQRSRRLSGSNWRRLAGVLALSALGLLAAFFFLWEFPTLRAARTVRAALQARQFDRARAPLERWLKARPGSAEAHYYRAWLALAGNQPQEAVSALEQASALGYDRTALDCLRGLILARSGQGAQAEPLLRRAYNESLEPQIDVAKELAAIYLSRFEFDRAGTALARWRRLAPDDPLPYLWRNEIDLRSDADSAVLIQNYRAALDRDPNLARARFGLAEQLRKARRYEEAGQEYDAYLAQHPDDVDALVGAGRNAFEKGDLPAAARSFEAALRTNPRDTDALRETAQLDIRRGDFTKARERLQQVIAIDPFDPETHYSYARVLKFLGDDRRSEHETKEALRLRKEHEHMADIRDNLVKNPMDIDLRYEAARWLLEHGHDDEGLGWTRQILQTRPDHAPTHRLLASYYEGKGNAGLANYHRSLAGAGPDTTAAGAASAGKSP